MDLNDLIPDNSSNWIVDKNTLFFKKYLKIPICYIDADTDVVFVSLDHRIHKGVSKLVKHLMSLDIEFYMCYPDLMNPKGVDGYINKIIYHYFLTYITRNFKTEFEKIQFDLIQNLCEWVEKEDCFDLMKELYDEVKEKANDNWRDWYSNKLDDIYRYDKDIREDYNALWREIQINLIIK
jgi:hypothetical protein